MEISNIGRWTRIWIFSAACMAWTSISTRGASPSPEESVFIENPRQLILTGRRSGEGYFSSDGTKLVFQAEREDQNPFFQIYTLNLTDGEIQRVSPGIGKTTCSFFHPNGRELLFASTHHDPRAIEKQKMELERRESGNERRYAWDYDPTMDIFKKSNPGSAPVALTHAEGYDAEGSYSPDGRWIAFCSTRHAFPLKGLNQNQRERYAIDPSFFGEIYLMHADGTKVRRLTQHPGYDGGPFFSPNGKRIVWRRFDEEGINADILTMRLDGTDVQEITSNFGMAWAPFYHPSGEYIIFTSNREGFSNFELYIVDRRGNRQPLRISFTNGFDGLPVFSPDGNMLVWTSNRYASNPGSQHKGHLFAANWNHEAALRALQTAPLRKVEKKKAVLSSHAAHPSPSLTGSESNPGNISKAKDAILYPDILQADLKRHVKYLASDALEGRMTGEKGAQMAADYIVDSLKEMGISPMDSLQGYYQPFEFTSGVEVAKIGNALDWKARTNADTEEPSQTVLLESGFRPLAFTSNGSFRGEVVFAGYGLKVPGEAEGAYNSYAGLNVSNKVAMVLRYVPEAITPERRSLLNRYASLRYKALIARELGAKGILVVSGPNSPNAGKLIPLQSDQSLGDSGILAATITGKLADQLLDGTGHTLQKLQDGLDQENPHATGSAEIKDKSIHLELRIKRMRKKGRNVIGIMHPPNSVPGENEYIMLGAHYDHLGFGETGGFKVKGEEHQIHNGADDNASGVAAVLEIAGAMKSRLADAKNPAGRGVILSFWSGEELGLIGSSHFASEPPLPLQSIHAYLNFDMVGRLRKNKLILQGIGSAKHWKTLIEKRNILSGFHLILQEDPYLPTDTTAFYPKEIPVLSFFTGSHEAYHRPSDDYATLNWKGLERITLFADGMVHDLIKNKDHRLDYVKVAVSSKDGNRDTLRVFLGTIPDYAADIEGVKLNGVRKGGPADKAGLRAGDVIISFAGQSIKNIYDYTYALDAATIGKVTTVTIRRMNQVLKLRIKPSPRP
jgi:hypothetical protein